MQSSLQRIPWAGALLLFLSLWLLIFQDYAAFILCAVIGASVSVVILGFIVINKDAIRFCWIISAALLVGYAGGVVLTWLNTASFEEFSYAAKYRSLPLLSVALAMVYVCCGIGLILGRFEKPCFSGDHLPEDSSSFEIFMVVSGLLVIFAAYLNGDYGYGGVQVDEATSRISAWGAIADLVAPPTAGLCGYIIGRSRSNIERGIYSAFALIALTSIVPSGRRSIILALIVVAIGFCLSGGLRRLRFFQIALGAGGLAVFAYLTTSYFYALRLSNWELGPTSQLTDQMSLALEFLVSPSLQDRFSTLLSENIRERTFTLGYLADLIEATYRTAPLYGEALLFHFRIAVPSFLDPSKSTVLDYQQIETLAHPKLGLPVMDQSNSVLTDGVTDFGAPGALIYLLGIILLAKTTFSLLQKMPTPVSCLFAGLALIYLGLKPEFTLADYFVTIRNLGAVFAMFSIIEYLSMSRQSATLLGDGEPLPHREANEPSRELP